MRHITHPVGELCALAQLMLLLWASHTVVHAIDQTGELITLDPICAMPESRTPKLPPGNPAPSTRRMAQLLAEMNERLPPPPYASERIVSTLLEQLAHTTNLSERAELQFRLGIEQTQAGRPDSALNTFAALG